MSEQTKSITNHKFGIRSGRRYLSVALILAVGLFISLAAFVRIRIEERARIRGQFRRAAENRISALKRHTETDILFLKSLRSFYAASEQVTRSEFQTFVKPFLSPLPCIQAVEWIPRVRREERTTYEQAARSDGFPDFQITERKVQGQMVRAGDRDEYFPVYFVEPYEGNERTVGFDLASSPARLEALNLSRDTGELMATGRITLVQETTRQFGFLIFAPIYQKGASTHSVQDRRKNLKGFVLGVFRIDDLAEKALACLGPGGIDIYLYDTSARPGERFLYVHSSRFRKTPAPRIEYADAHKQKGFSHTTTLDVAGRKWLVLCTASPEFTAARETWVSWSALIVGVMITALLACYLVSMTSRTARIERLAGDLGETNRRLKREIEQRRQTERALKESEEKFKAIFENAGGAIFIADIETGNILECNREAEKLIGRSRDEIIGMHQSKLHPAGEAEKYKEKFALHVQMGRLVDYEGEVRHSSGRKIPVWIAAQTVEISSRSAIIGLFVDVTDRKEAEQKLKNTVTELERFNKLAVGRELRMIELKRQVNELAEKAGVDPPYHLEFAETIRGGFDNA